MTISSSDRKRDEHRKGRGRKLLVGKVIAKKKVQAQTTINKSPANDFCIVASIGLHPGKPITETQAELLLNSALRGMVKKVNVIKVIKIPAGAKN
jgi:hypothetical protein